MTQETRVPVWARDEKGRRSTLTREAIVRAAIAVADAEGLEAVSIRRVATELDARAMSLYTYIERKEDLLDLMADEVAAEVLVPDGELPSDWREALVTIARRERAASRRHPWMIDLVARRSTSGHVGPNMLRHTEQSMAALTALGGDMAWKWRVTVAVGDYTTGFIVREAREDTGANEAVTTYLRRLTASGEFPHLAAVLDQEADNVDAFEAGLRWLLDGIAGDLARRERAALSGNAVVDEEIAGR